MLDGTPSKRTKLSLDHLLPSAAVRLSSATMSQALDSKQCSLGSSKRKRKLPVQYIPKPDEEAEEEANDVQIEESFSAEPQGPGFVSQLPDYSLLHGSPRKLVTDSYLLVPDVDEESPRSMEPQPTTTICYKPSPGAKQDSKTRVESERNQEEIAKMLQKIQKDLEASKCTERQTISAVKREPTEKVQQSAIPFRSSASSSGQTYNLDLFKRLAHKAQTGLADNSDRTRREPTTHHQYSLDLRLKHWMTLNAFSQEKENHAENSQINSDVTNSASLSPVPPHK